MDTVLILDADRVSRRRTISAIRYGGFQAESARNLQEACRLVRRHRYAALVVDPGVGADSSLPVEELRARTDAPIIVVSARDEASYKVALLDAGADDCVTRPFDPEELLARIRAVERRVAPLEEERPIVTPDFTMHVADRRFVRPDGAEVTMSPTEWRLIEVLVQHAGHLVTREELLVSVWGPQAASKTQYLRVHMSSIRQKVEPDPARPRYFVTVPGLGVRFDAEGGTPSGAAQSLTPTG
jgi:two-component system KDP operon response regulator KdpE